VILALLDEAKAGGARLERACEVLGLTARTVVRWRAEGGGADRRAGAGASPAHKLTAEERARIVELATSEEYRDLSPRQFVPLLADKGIYVASESTFYRVLREEQLLAPPRAVATEYAPSAAGARRGESKPGVVVGYHVPAKPCPRGVLLPVLGARRVQPQDRGRGGARRRVGELASTLVEWACDREGATPEVLHADNGAAMKGGTMLATLQRLGVIASFSRPLRERRQSVRRGPSSAR
jgi:putative transposase